MTTRILVIEDDAGIRNMLTDCLVDAGYAVLEAAHGYAALDILGTGGSLPQLILLDLAMPLMSGQEFLKQWRGQSSASQVPVIVLTADQREQELAAILGVACVLTKPVEIDTLLDAVDRFALAANGNGK